MSVLTRFGFYQQVSGGTPPIDENFYLLDGFNYNLEVYTTTIDSNGKIYVGGSFTTYQGVAANRIIRLNPDGSIDSEFDYGAGFNDDVLSIVEDTNGKIYCVGRFSIYKGVTANKIIRLNPDGSKDTDFTTPISVGSTGGGNAVNSIAIDSNGKIYCGGAFNSFNSITTYKIVRFDTDGTVDTTFNTGTGFSNDNNGVFAITIDSNGKIYVGGAFTTYQGVTANRIIRLNTDGSKDTAFDNTTGFGGEVRCLEIDSNGKIYVGGAFTTYQGVSANRIIRLNTDGSIDTGFVYGGGFNGTAVYSIVEGSNGKIYVGGAFTTYQGVSANRIISLNTDGTKDTYFDNTTGFNTIVRSLAIDSNGKIYCGGEFNFYKGVLKYLIEKLNVNGDSLGKSLFTPATPTYTYTSTQINLTWTNNADDKTAIKIYKDNVLYDTIASTETTYIDTGAITGNTYLYKTGAYINVDYEKVGSNVSVSMVAPIAVTNLTGNTDNNNAYLSWINNHTYAQSIVVYKDNVLESTISSTALNYNVTGLTSGTTYEFKVAPYIAGFTENFTIWSGTTTAISGSIGNRPINCAVYNSSTRTQYTVGTWSTGKITIAYWVRFDDNSTNEIAHKGSTGNGEVSTLRTDGKIYCEAASTGNLTVSTGFIANKWYLIVASCNNNSPDKLFIYDEAGLIETLTLTAGQGAAWDGQSAFVLGGRTGSATSGRGRMNAVGIWTEPLSDIQVTTLWNVGDGLQYSNLAGVGLDTNLYDWWDLNSTVTSNKLSNTGSAIGTVTFTAI